MGKAMVLRENQSEDNEEQMMMNLDSCDSHVSAILNKIMSSK
jgi:hypothetical protein